jgi:hypothetical protein
MISIKVCLDDHTNGMPNDPRISFRFCPPLTESSTNGLLMPDFDTFRSRYDAISNVNPLLGSNLAMYSSLLYHPLASISSRFEAQRSALQYLYAYRNPFWHSLFDNEAFLSRVNNPLENANYLVHVPEPSSIMSNDFTASDSDGKKNVSKSSKGAGM